MTRSERVRFEMLLRLRDFGAAHKDRFPESSAGARAFGDVARAVGEIETHAVNRIVTGRESARVRADRRTFIVERLRTIAHTSKGIRTASGARLRLRMPDSRSDTAILNAARAFLREAAPYQEQLVSLGLPPTYFAELGEAADGFAAALTERRTGRSGEAGAKGGINAAFLLGADAARTLDIVVPNVLGGDPVAMAAWQRDRRVVGRNGKDAPATDTEPAPVTPDTPVAKPPAAA